MTEINKMRTQEQLERDLKSVRWRKEELKQPLPRICNLSYREQITTQVSTCEVMEQVLEYVLGHRQTLPQVLLDTGLKETSVALEAILEGDPPAAVNIGDRRIPLNVADSFKGLKPPVIGRGDFNI